MDPEQTTTPEETEDIKKPYTFTTISVQVKGRPPAGTGDEVGDEIDGDGLYGTSTGTNPFSILLTTNETSSTTVTFTYGQGTTTFADVDLPTYFTSAPTSTVVTAVAPNATLPFSVLTVGTVYWVQASGSGLTTAQQSFKRTV